MIYKELDDFYGDDKFARAGRAAEEKMAFYLKRFFAADPDLLVLNGIRLQTDGDAAQIDHLIIHQYGLVIVESKSVHGKIQIKDDGQWVRWYKDKQSKGMASPLTQAEMQARFFRERLGNAANQQEAFQRIAFDVLIAISDDGVILWPKSGPLERVCKADQIPERIEAIRRQRSAPGNVSLSPANREKIAAYLAAMNRPLRAEPVIAPKAPEPEPVAVTQPPSVPDPEKQKCRHCTSPDLEIRYGYSYYFFCKSCGKNMPIDPVCPTCDKPARLRKQKSEFFVECPAGHSALYFLNP